MLRLVFTVCMIQTPDTCEQREMLVYESMHPTACVMGAIPELAVWRQTHPDWRIARWRCEGHRAARPSGSDGDRAEPTTTAARPEAPALGSVPVALAR